MRDIFFEYLQNSKEVIIYGCGYYGKVLQWLLQYHGIAVDYFCDSNGRLWGEKVNNVLCISPEELKKHNDAVVIIAISKYQEVYEKLKTYTMKRLFTWDNVKSLWEDLKSDRDGAEAYLEERLTEDKILCDILKRNEKYKDIHSGERCFIIGNGPSVREMELSALKQEYVFTVNQFARSTQFNVVDSNYHIWVDYRFFAPDLQCEGDYELLSVMRNQPSSVQCFFPYKDAHAYVEKFELDKYVNVNYFEQNELSDLGREVDFTRYIPTCTTVVHIAIRLALYMGFKEIYLLGCECTTILNVINAKLDNYSSVTHCYDIDDKEKERARKMYGADSIQVYYEGEMKLIEGYRNLNEYCRKRDILLVNCTPGGLLEELPRKSFEEVIKG